MNAIEELIRSCREEYTEDIVTSGEESISLLDVVDTAEKSLSLLGLSYVTLDFEIRKAAASDKRMEVRRLTSWQKTVYRLMEDLFEYRLRNIIKEENLLDGTTIRTYSTS